MTAAGVSTESLHPEKKPGRTPGIRRLVAFHTFETHPLWVGGSLTLQTWNYDRIRCVYTYGHSFP